ncbi:hypothetical protein AB4156_07250 [Cupriavidus sp. 2MCAB6]|uniref:hypothetical protein n=1 Tax=Cupriavidus sp. 2MCAB6 TaxID=3232981 RepID=UPI003F8E53FC
MAWRIGAVALLSVWWRRPKAGGMQMMAWQFGPQLSDNSLTRFRLWAPDAIEQGWAVRLEVLGLGPTLMRESSHGWLEVEAPCGAGSRYWFRLDNGMSVPDPASRAQAVDVQGASIVCDASSYAWCNPDWLGRPLAEAVIHETDNDSHCSFMEVASHLPALAARGFTAVSLNPHAQDSVACKCFYAPLPFAPERSYGGLNQLRALVDRAHGLGMMVLVTLAYDQFVSEGNQLGHYASPFFQYNGSGNAINFQHPAVRQYFTENVLYWLIDFQIDGLYLVVADSAAAECWISELAATVRATLPEERRVHLLDCRV